MKNPTLYCRLYCDLSDHPKILRAQAFLGGGSEHYDRIHGLWNHMACWTTRQQADGFIPNAIIATAPSTDPIRTAAALIEVGILIAEPGGYRIHNWLERNISAEQLASRRDKEKRKKARQRQAKRARVSPGDTRGESRVDPPGTAHGDSVRDSGTREGSESDQKAIITGNPEKNGDLYPHVSPGDIAGDTWGDTVGKMYPPKSREDRGEYQAESGDRDLSGVLAHSEKNPARATAQSGTEATNGHKPRAEKHRAPVHSTNGNGHGKTASPIHVDAKQFAGFLVRIGESWWRAQHGATESDLAEFLKTASARRCGDLGLPGFDYSRCVIEAHTAILRREKRADAPRRKHA